ncbi:hypothetical protein [Cupriavidus numazuensis]|uniref:Uncharacterized protein n=1 Tax=Cupriavidus numazuensis TaxID=221992 RepID=A0ABM8TAN8_9BURK|nr:hypothetical protein [Cupriavidus numazuensis]CAG2130733.1 hypothetical protein LMG26411_00403 [Cupriavidus numazuensis]
MSDSKAASPLTSEERLLASIAYGEASTQDSYEEMAAIASVMVRQMKARGYTTIDSFTKSDKTFSFAVTDGNERYAKMMKAKDTDIVKSAALSDAVKASKNAFAGGQDYSNGAYFWDGADIKSNYKNHAKVKKGVHIDPAHNVYGIPDSEKLKILNKTVKKKVNGKVVTSQEEVGRYSWVYESTAGVGGTIFWRYGRDFVNVTRAKEYR